MQKFVKAATFRQRNCRIAARRDAGLSFVEYTWPQNGNTNFHVGERAYHTGASDLNSIDDDLELAAIPTVVCVVCVV